MEEKILNPQAAMTFDIQRFATVNLDDNKTYNLTVGDYTVTCNFSGVTNISTIDVTDNVIKIGTKSFTISAEQNGSISFTGTTSKISSINVKNVSVEYNSLTYKATNSTITFGDKISISGDVEISGDTSEEIFSVSSGTKATINDVDFLSNGGTAIEFGTVNSTVTLTGAFTIGDGEQTLNLSINDVTYSGAGQISVTTSAVNISGTVTAKNNLTGKTYSLTDDDKLNANFSLKSNDTTKIGDVTYSATNAVELNVVKDKITLVSGTVTVGTGSESLSGKEFSVTSAKATFKPLADVKINDVTYTAKTGDCTIEVDGNVTLTGEFSVTLAAEKSVTINDVKFTADSEGVTFTLNSTTNEVTFTSGSLAMKVNGNLKVNGVTYQDANGTMDFEDASTVTLAGDFTVEAEEGHFLSNTTFSTTSGDSTFNASSGDTVKLNDATFTAGSSGLTLKDNSESVTITGTGATVEGTGTFIASANTSVTINGTDFESTKSATINYTDENTATLSSKGNFTLSNVENLTIAEGSKVEGATIELTTNGKVNVGGVTYSGSGGTIDIDEDDADTITLSGSSITVGDGAEQSLNGKAYTTDNCAVEFNVSEGDSVTINNESYQADANGSTVSVDSQSNATMSGEFTVEEVDGNKTFTLKENDAITYGDVKYIGKSSDAEVTVNGKTITISAGTVAIENIDNLSEYTFNIASGTTAQINDIDYKKTGSGTGNGDIVFYGDSVTLNSNFTIGDGEQKLNGLKVKLASGVSAIVNLYNLGESGDGEQTLSGDSVEVDGITYAGTGTINTSTSAKTATLDGTIAVTGTVTGYNFTLTKDYEYTFGGTTIYAGNISSNISVSGITGDLTSDTVLSSVTIGSKTLSLTAGSGYTINLKSDGTISSVTTKDSGTFTVDSTTFNVTEGTVTFNLDSDLKITTVTSSDNAKLTVDSTAITLSATDKLQKYSNGVWATTPPYDSYVLSNGTIWGVYSTGKSDTVTSVSGLEINGNTATWTGDKSLTVEGTFKVIAGSKTYDIESGGATFTNSGITSVDSGVVKSSSNGIVKLGDNATFKFGDTYTYTETDADKTSANITIGETGGVTVTDGTINKTINVGNFTYKNGTYTVDNSATFEVVQGRNDNASLISGGGTSDVAVGSSVNIDGTDITVSESSKYLAKGDTDGGYTAFEGTGTYDVEGGNFTAETNKEYTISGNATYQLTATGEKTGGITTELKTATGTRAFTTGDTYTTSFDNDTYTAIDGKYTLSITDGTEGTKSFTSGNATYNISSGENFHYNQKAYTATTATNLKISIDGTTYTLSDKSGAGTRNADGSTDKTTYNNDTYTLDSTAKIKLTLSDAQENFEEGSATYSANVGTSFHYDNKEYTAKENATLTLTKDNGVTSTALTTGSGTRADLTATTFTPKDSTKTYTTTGGVTYILEPNKSEVVYAASGSRTDVNDETYPIGNHTYTLSAGTYNITIAEKVGAESLTSGEGTASIAEGITFNHDSKEYTAFGGNVTLNLSVDNSTPTETFSTGKGTRPAESNEKTVSTIDTDKTYTIGDNSKMLLETTGVTFYDGSATRTITDETFKVSGNDNQYTAEGDATLTMTQTAGSESVELTAGNGTREQAAPTFEYDNKIYTDTATSGNVTYILKTNQTVEELYSAQGTRDYADGNVEFNNDTYQITGTYSFTLNKDGSTSESLTAAGTYSAGNGETFHFGDKTYQGFDSGATLTITYNDKTAVLNSAEGTGTRAAYGNETTAYDNNTYVVNKDSIIKVDITSKDNSTENFYDGTATQTYTSGSGVFHFKDQDYTAQGDATLTLTKTNDIVTATTLTGNGTRTDNDETFTTTGFADTFTATGNIVYQISDSDAEKVYSAEGTRSFASTDDFKTTYDSDEYTATAGTYSISVVEGAGTRTLSSGSATYTTSDGVFHFKNQTYSAVSETTLTISLKNDAAKELTAASGVGTRTATTADSNITYEFDSDTYSTNSGSIIKAVVSNKDTVEETFLTGTATYTTNNETFHYDNKAYTAVSNTTITLTYDGTTHSKTFSANSAGTRSDTENKFTYNINGPIYDRTSTDITYLVEGSGATLTEKVFTAKGTRSAINDSFEGNWGNSYTIANGIYSIDVIGGSGNDTVSNAQATNTYGLNQIFNYDGTAYTATNYQAVLSLSVTDNTPTESFDSGSGKNGDDYIIKTQADIGDVTYSSNNNIVKVDTTDDAITAIDGAITGTFANNEVATIDNINYTAKAASTLQVNSMTDVKVTQGSFEATGNFSTARTINGKALTVTDDTSVKVAFDTTNGITEISDLDAGATVSYSGNATIKTTGDGTYTFDNQTFVIAGDSEPGVTFTMADGTVTKIEGLDRSDSGSYVTVDITDNGTNLSRIIRTPGAKSIERGNNEWSVPELDIESYIVTYDGNFKVQAVTSGSVITLTTTDYTVDGATLTITGDTKPTVVTNSSTDTITVGSISGIENTGGKAVQIDANGNLHIGTQNADGTFTESENVSAFSVSDKGKFSVDGNGKITVEAKDATQTVEITITDTSKATLDIGSSGTFEINGKSSVEITGYSGDPVQLVFNEDGGVDGFVIPENGSGSITIEDIDEYIVLGLASSADLTEYSVKTYKLKLSTGTTVNLDIINNSTTATFTYGNGKITDISNLNNEAMIKFSSMDAISPELNINGADVVKGTNSSGEVLSAKVVANEKIRYNSTNKAWTCGLAAAQTDATYKAEINANDEILLYVGTTQIKNVNDYKAVFGDAYKPDYDDDVLPKYGSSITLNSNVSEFNVSELKISPPGSKEYTINSKKITLTGEATIKPVSSNFSGDVTVELKNGVSAIYNNMTFSGNNDDVTITIPASGAITIPNNTKVTASSFTDKTFTASGTVSFNDITVEGLSSTSISSIDTASSKLTIGTNALNVTGDSKYTVSAGTNPYIKGISDAANVKGAFAQNASIVTEGEGNFSIFDRGFAIIGDTEVTLKTDGSDNITDIGGLDNLASIQGSANHTTFLNVTKVNGQYFAGSGNSWSAIGLVGGGKDKLSRIYNLKNGISSSILKFAGATLLSTDGNPGEFGLGESTNNKSYSVSGAADFVVDAYKVTEIRNMTGGTSITPYQDETGLIIGKDTITVAAGRPTFEMGNGTISGALVTVTGSLSGLSKGATVNVKTTDNFKINSADVQINDSDYYVYVKDSTGYDLITGLDSGAVVTAAKNASLVATLSAGSTGTFTFGGNQFAVKGDENFTFVTDGSSNVTNIADVSNATVSVYSAQNGLRINGKAINVEGTSAAPAKVKVGGNGDILGFEGLKSSGSYSLPAGATINVDTTGEVTINGKKIQLTNTVNNAQAATVRATENGYDLVTGLVDGAVITTAEKDAIIIPNAGGTFTFGATGSQQTIKTDSQPTFTMGSSKTVSAISGVSGNVALYQPETGLKVLNDTITVKGATSNDALTLVTGNGSINQVKNLKGDVNGLNVGALVNVKTANAVKINSSSNAVQISEGTNTADYTVRATSDGYDLITGLDSRAVVTTAKNASLVATLAANDTGTYTFGSSKFDISGDENFTFITDANSSLVNIADVSYATISVYDTQNGLKINGKAINVEGSTNNPIKVKVGGGGEILGFDGLKETGSYSLPAGATVEVDTSAGNNITINNQDLKINNVSDKVTVRAKDDGYDIVSGIKNNAVITTAKNATLVTGAVGTFKFNGQTLKTSDDAQITLQTNASSKVTMVGGLDAGKGLDFYQPETNIVLGVSTLTFDGVTDSENLKVTMGAGDTISTVKNLKGDIKGLSAGASVEVATNSNIKLNDDSKTLQISNVDTNNKVTVHTTADGYDSVVGLKNGADVKASKDVTLYSAENGTYTFNGKAFTTDGDATIGFVMGDENALAHIWDFNGTMGGNFSESVMINNKTVNVTTGDTAINIVGAGGTEGISKITQLNKNSTINNAGGATTITAAEAGQFTFKTGNTYHKFSLSGTADFLSAQYTDYNPSITGIKNLTSGTVVAYQEEKGLTVGNSIVTISGAAGDYPVSLGITNSTISGVDNLKGEISGLSGGATVNTADGEVTINNSRLNITGTNTAATVYARDYNDGYGYGTIKGFAAGVTFAEAKNTSLVTNVVGDYTFGSETTHKFTTANDADVTIATDADSKVTAIGGLESATLTFYQSEEDFVINGKTIKIKDVPTIGTDDEKKVAVSVDAYGNIVGVGNLKGAISNLPTNVSVSIADSEVTINNSKLKISDGAATVYAKEGNGYGTITGVNSGATIVGAKNSSIIATAAAGSAGTYTFGENTKTHKFVMGGASAATVTIATDFDGNVTAVGGMDNDESLAVYQKELDLWIDGKQIQIDNVPSGEAVTLKSNGSKISEVGNLKGLINNLSTNVTVQVADAEVTINGETFKIDKGSSTADATVVTGVNGSNTITGVTSGVNISAAKNASIVATVSANNVTGTYNFGGDHKFAVDGDSDVTIATDINSKVTAIGGLESATLTFYQSEEDFVINGKTIKVKDVPPNDNVAVSVDAYGNIVGVGNLKGAIYNLPTNVTVNVMDSDVTINGAALKIAEGTTNFTVISTANGYDTVTGIADGATIDTAQNVSIVATVNDANAAKSFTFSDSDSNHKFSIADANSVTIATDHNSKATAIGGFIGTLTSPEEYNVINGASIYSSNTDVSIAAATDTSVAIVYGTVKGANISVPAGVTVQASVKPEDVSADTTFTVNGTAYALLGDGDKIEIKDRTITGLDADARLTITGAVGSFNVNGTDLNITTTQNIVIGEGSGAARLYDPNDIDFGANTPVEDIVKQTMGSTTNVSSVTIQPDGNGNVTESNKVVVVEDANKTLNVSGNSDLIIIEKNAAHTNITANGESDTIIVSANDANVTGNKATHVMPTSGVTMTYSDYNHSLNAGLQITNADVISAVKDNDVLKFNGTQITLPNKATVTMTYDDTKGIVNFYNIQGEMQKVGYTYSDNNTIDYRNLNGDIVLKGNWTTSGGVASTLYGGNGNDTAFGSVGDFFNLGNGSNYIEISSTRTDGNATIESNATNGDTTVKGFKANDFDNGDVIKIATSEDRTGVTYSGSNLIFTDKNYNTTLSIADMTASEESGSVGYVNVLIADINSTDTVKTSIAKRGMVINVADEVNKISKSYVGDNSGIDFSNLDSDATTANAATVNINLGDNKGTIDSTEVELRGITSLKGGVGSHTLTGNATVNNTLAAGEGAATLYGGGSSDDYLIGNATDDDKQGANTFIYKADGDGNDTIGNFQFFKVSVEASEGSSGDATEEDDNTQADRINLDENVDNYIGAEISGNDVVLKFKDGNSLTVKDGVGERFSVEGFSYNKAFNDHVNWDGDLTVLAQVDNTELTYDGFTTNFYAVGENAKLNVADTITNALISIVDDTDSGLIMSGDFRVLNAVDAGAGLSLVGNNYDNTIKASNNGSSLSGGSGAANDGTNDVLIGGNGADVFYYGYHEGNDTISGYDYDKDIIYLHNYSIKNARANINVTLSGNAMLAFNTNETLTISDSTKTKFKLADNNVYDGWDEFKTALTTASNADIAEDWEEIHYQDELLDGEVTFWKGNDISADDNNYLTDEILIGDIQFSMSAGDTLYTFSDK